MKKVVVNKCFGGFNLSHAAVTRYAERKGITLYPEIDKISLKVWRDHHPGEELTFDDPFAMVHYYKVPPEQYKALEQECRENENNYRRLNEKDWYFSEREVARDDPDLVAVVEELDGKANGSHASLEVIEIPDDVEWEVEEYDGQEWIAESHRTWS